jgi:predicted phage terminase large subunit-like protein
MEKMTASEYQAFCRSDFSTFAHRAFLELNPQASFLPNWHIDLIAAKLEACRRRELTRLIINVPPRSLKSHLAAVCFPAFLLGHQPSSQIICASYGQDLANKHSLDCRTLMASLWYQRLFRARLASHRQSLQEFVTTENGFRLATSVGGVLTGRGADFIIIDDPLKPEEALSETLRKNANEWFDHTLRSRLNDKRTGCIIIIMQRLHEDDLVGHVLEKEQWEHIKLAAIAEEDETHLIESRYQVRTIQRKVGKALHPEREPVEILEHLRRTVGEYNFAGQYQQLPAPLGGGLVKAKWFRTYIHANLPKFNRTLQSWDTANKSTELSDYSVCTTWGQKGRRLYLLNVSRARLDYPSLKRAVRRLSCEFHPDNILIEDKASGTQLIQELINEGVYGVTRYEPQMEKIMRLHSVTSVIENGFVYLPNEAEWLSSYLHELTTFPNGRFDDQTDSTSQALDFAKAQVHRYPLQEYWRREAIRRGLPVDPALMSNDDLDAYELDRRVCQGCGSGGPAQYGRRYHCNQCGHEWKTLEGLRDEPRAHRCTLETGETLIWDEYTQLWVDPITADTYRPEQ